MNDRELYERAYALHNCGRTLPDAEFGIAETLWWELPYDRMASRSPALPFNPT